jgi:hypothetical protein
LDHLSARKAPVEYFTKTLHIVQRHLPKLRLVEEFPRIERSMDPSSLSLDDIKHAYNITTSKEDPMRKLCIKSSASAVNFMKCLQTLRIPRCARKVATLPMISWKHVPIWPLSLHTKLNLWKLECTESACCPPAPFRPSSVRHDSQVGLMVSADPTFYTAYIDSLDQ